jgi:hypothetical protein
MIFVSPMVRALSLTLGGRLQCPSHSIWHVIDSKQRRDRR